MYRARMSSLRLEPLAERHVPFMTALVADPDVLRFTRVPEPVPDGFAERWVARYEAGRLEGTRAGFVAVDDGGRPLALALAPEIHAEAAEAELGYIVGPDARGRGVATESLRLLTEWAFRERDIERAYLYISVENPASKRVAERCGYVKEGVLRSVYVKPGLREDVEIWSRLRSDEPVSRAD
jgi:RimJ/RimL family protein N-acetyltransferase